MFVLFQNEKKKKVLVEEVFGNIHLQMSATTLLTDAFTNVRMYCHYMGWSIFYVLIQQVKY